MATVRGAADHSDVLRDLNCVSPSGATCFGCSFGSRVSRTVSRGGGRKGARRRGSDGHTCMFGGVG